MSSIKRKICKLYDKWIFEYWLYINNIMESLFIYLGVLMSWLFFFILDFLKRNFRFKVKVSGNCRVCIYHVFLKHSQPNYQPTLTVIHFFLNNDDFFFFFGEPTLTYAKSIIYIKIHSWCSICHGFGHIYNDIYTPLKYCVR